MKNNKGFSLVELIIVIAIMAILAAAIAPALIRYINKARKADDLTAAGEIVSAANTAMTNEAANDAVMNNTAGVSVSITDGAVTGNPTALVDEMKKTLPNGAKKKYVKDGSASYVLTYDATKEIFICSTDTSVELNPTPGGDYSE